MAGGQSRPVVRTAFVVRDGDEPHKARRKEILAAHPEVQALFGYEWRWKYCIAALVVTQLAAAHWAAQQSWPLFLATAYIVGGTTVNALFLAIHEGSHNLLAATVPQNRALCAVANLPILFHYFSPFKVYHTDHHKNQGHSAAAKDGSRAVLDGDIPSMLEATIFNGAWLPSAVAGPRSRSLLKAIWLQNNLLWYALRPCLVEPHRFPHDTTTQLWSLFQFSVDALICYVSGPKALAYLLLSMYLATSFHPCAGHFLAEHVVVDGTSETYSYYGPLNWLAFNVGYHNEHHDFPNIPGSRLPALRKIAPEFYDSLPQTPSWPGLLYKFVVDDSVNLFSRVIRA